MIQYFAEYRDTENVLHRFEIERDSYTGSPIEITGYVELEYLEVDDILEAIRGSALRVHLDASEQLTFNDLYTDDERIFKVTYYRGGQLEFVGFLNPDGVYQDWVNDKWELSLDVSDGLGYLENLAYVDDSGLQITSIEKEIHILARALKRCGLSLPIYTNIRTRYSGLSSSLDGLNNTLISQARYQRSDGTLTTCKEVIDSILKKYGAFIMQYRGSWVITDLFSINNGLVTFYKYDANGNNGTTEQISMGTAIGSQINNFYPHHCGANQRLEISPALRKVRVVYKYGFRVSIVNNPEMVNDGTTINSWNIEHPAAVSLPNPDSVRLTKYSGYSGQRILESDYATLNEGTALKTKFTFKGESNTQTPTVLVTISLTDGTDFYFLRNDGSWVETAIGDTSKIALLGSKINTIELTTEPTPITGTASIQIDILDEPQPVGSYMDLYYMGVYPVEPEEVERDDVPEGEFSDSQRTGINSSVVRENIDLFNADGDVGTYEGAIFKADGVSGTTTWNSISGTPTPILTEAGIIQLTNKQKPAKVFKGDVYGPINPLGVINIDGISGNFVIRGIKCNTKDNITSVVFQEFFTNYPGDIVSELSIDYGDTSKPTID